MEASNALAATPWEVTVMLVALAAAALFVTAIISLSRSIQAMPAKARLGWLLVISLLPVLGACLWLSLGRRKVLARKAI